VGEKAFSYGWFLNLRKGRNTHSWQLKKDDRESPIDASSRDRSKKREMKRSKDSKKKRKRREGDASCRGRMHAMICRRPASKGGKRGREVQG